MKISSFVGPGLLMLAHASMSFGMQSQNFGDYFSPGESEAEYVGLCVKARATVQGYVAKSDLISKYTLSECVVGKPDRDGDRTVSFKLDFEPVDPNLGNLFQSASSSMCPKLQAAFKQETGREFLAFTYGSSYTLPRLTSTEKGAYFVEAEWGGTAFAATVRGLGYKFFDSAECNGILASGADNAKTLKTLGYSKGILIEKGFYTDVQEVMLLRADVKAHIAPVKGLTDASREREVIQFWALEPFSIPAVTFEDLAAFGGYQTREECIANRAANLQHFRSVLINGASISQIFCKQSDDRSLGAVYDYFYVRYSKQ